MTDAVETTIETDAQTAVADAESALPALTTLTSLLSLVPGIGPEVKTFATILDAIVAAAPELLADGEKALADIEALWGPIRTAIGNATVTHLLTPMASATPAPAAS